MSLNSAADLPEEKKKLLSTLISSEQSNRADMKLHSDEYFFYITQGEDPAQSSISAQSQNKLASQQISGMKNGMEENNNINNINNKTDNRGEETVPAATQQKPLPSSPLSQRKTLGQSLLELPQRADNNSKNEANNQNSAQSNILSKLTKSPDRNMLQPPEPSASPRKWLIIYKYHEGYTCSVRQTTHLNDF